MKKSGIDRIATSARAMKMATVAFDRAAPVDMVVKISKMSAVRTSQSVVLPRRHRRSRGVSPNEALRTRMATA